MTPTVRSRLLAAGTSFVLGFAMANYGILAVSGDDRWLWVVTAVALMLTGAIGVLIADSTRHISVWAVLGLEILVVFTLTPLLWMFTEATTTSVGVPAALIPMGIDWSRFATVFTGQFAVPLMNSLIVSLVSTVIAISVAVPAAYAIARMNAVYGPWLYVVAVALMLTPILILDFALADQMRALGVLGFRLAPVAGSLLLTVPLALWLCVSVLRDVPWTLRDSVVADGARRADLIRSFILPILGPSVAVAAALTFVAAVCDVAVSATMLSSASSMTLPGAILLAGQGTTAGPDVAAVALILLIPAAVLLLSVPQRILRLLGRTYE